MGFPNDLGIQLSGYNLPFIVNTDGSVLDLYSGSTPSGSDGGLSGGASIIGIPAFITNYGVMFQDYDDLVSDTSYFNVTFRTEQTPEQRSVTLTKLYITYTQGIGTLTWTLTGSLQGVAQTPLTGEIVLNYDGTNGQELQAFADLNCQFDLFQLSLSANGGGFTQGIQIVSVKLVTDIPDDEAV